MKIYGTPNPKEYKLELLTERLANVKLLMLIGKNDDLVAMEDFKYLK